MALEQIAAAPHLRQRFHAVPITGARQAFASACATDATARSYTHSDFFKGVHAVPLSLRAFGMGAGWPDGLYPYMPTASKQRGYH